MMGGVEQGCRAIEREVRWYVVDCRKDMTDDRRSEGGLRLGEGTGLCPVVQAGRRDCILSVWNGMKQCFFVWKEG